jgi:hypothetical protein
MSTQTDIIYRGIADYNRDIKRWAGKVRTELKSNVQSMSSQGTGNLAQKISASYGNPSGEIESISYKFPRYGIFFAKGVGRGHIMQGGKVVRGIKSSRVVRLLDGPVHRQPKDWFNNTIDKHVDELANTVASHKADEAVINAAHMKIK